MHGIRNIGPLTPHANQEMLTYTPPLPPLQIDIELHLEYVNNVFTYAVYVFMVFNSKSSILSGVLTIV